MRNSGKWLDYESQSCELVTRLSRGSRVSHNIKVKGKLSGGNRQIDICVRSQSAEDISKVYECKDHARPIGTPTIDALYGNLRETGAKSGAVISNSSFSGPAKNLAKASNIDLYHLINTDNDNIRVKIALRVVIQVAFLKSFKLSFMSSDIDAKLISDSDLIYIRMKEGDISSRDIVKFLWNETDSLSYRPGIYIYSPTNIKNGVLLTNGTKNIVAKNIKIQYEVATQNYFAEMGVEKANGLLNPQDESFISASELLTEKFDPVEFIRNNKPTNKTIEEIRPHIVIGLVAEM